MRIAPLAFVLVGLAVNSTWSSGQEPATGGAPAGTHRAAQDVGLNLSMDFSAIAELTSDSGAAPGSFRAAQDLGPRLDLSRQLEQGWQLDPVILHRRQAGQPQWAGEDLSAPTVGFEFRNRF